LNLQGSAAQLGKTLQSQTSQKMQNRLPVSRLGVLHERRITIQAWESADAMNAWYKGADYLSSGAKSRRKIRNVPSICG
jgi:hypothetical protein